MLTSLGLSSRSMRRRGLVAGAAAFVLVLPAAAPASAHEGDSQKLQRAVTLNGLLQHTRALQQIADSTGGNRAAGTSGHAASAGYVQGALLEAGYDVTLQQFEFPFFGEAAPAEMDRVTPDPVTFENGVDFSTMTYSGSGDVTAVVEGVDLTLPPAPEPGSTSGCEDGDFATFTGGNIALLQRGTCTFGEKALNAQEAGAAAVIIFNEGQEGRTELLEGTLGESSVRIPVVGTTFELGVELTAPGTEVRMETSTVNEIRSTYNVIAETPGGRADNVVMLGAHLDSVPEGPGINDNASGSAALIEVARHFTHVVDEPQNRVRFAWWSAEEFGLLGSAHYVANLSSTEVGDIALYLNFDMIASPNFGRFVYDGDDSDQAGAGPGPEGSAAIEDVFTDYFSGRELPTQGTDFTGRSDYGPFIEVGIPAGGLFTGAEELKSEDQATLFGGTAGVAFDPCYHEACDTSRNLSNRVFIQNADAIAHATAVFAESTEAVNGRSDASRTADARPAAALAATPHGTVAR